MRLELRLPGFLRERVRAGARAAGVGMGAYVARVLEGTLEREARPGPRERLLPSRLEAPLKALRALLASGMALDEPASVEAMASAVGAEAGELERWQREGLLPPEPWGMDLLRLVLVWALAALDLPVGALGPGRRMEAWRLRAPRGSWHLAVTVPSGVAQGVGAWSAALGMSRALYVGLALLGATGGRLEELSGRMGTRIPGLRLDDPLGLLREGMSVPLRPDGVYLEPELSHFLGLRPGSVASWAKRGVLQAIRAREGYTFVEGRAVLRLLAEGCLTYVEAAGVMKLAAQGQRVPRPG